MELSMETNRIADYTVDFGNEGGLHECLAVLANKLMSEKNTLSTESSGPLGEISQAPPAFEAFLDKHQTKIIVFAIILAIGAAVYVVNKGIVQSAEETAGSLLSKAEDISDLQGVVKNHEGTSAASSAQVLLADKQWQEGQQDDAVATLNAFIAGAKKHPALPNAKVSLASKLIAQGKNNEGVEILREITNDSNSRFLAPYAWILLGDVEVAKGDTKAATKAYEMVGTEFADSSFSRDASQRLLLLKALAPVEVAAPIIVPETNLTDQQDGDKAPGEQQIKDPINPEKEGAGDAGADPLLKESTDSE